MPRDKAAPGITRRSFSTVERFTQGTVLHPVLQAFCDTGGGLRGTYVRVLDAVPGAKGVLRG